MTPTVRNELTVVLAGEAGQGIQSIESILASLLKKSGYHYFSTPEFMSRVRGGANSTEIRISSVPAAAFTDRIDLLIPLTAAGLERLKHRITGTTVVVGEKEKISYDGIHDIRFTEIAREIGNAIYSNTVAAGFICGLLKIDVEECAAFIAGYFEGKSGDIQDNNVAAVRKGHEAGSGFTGINVTLGRSDDAAGGLLLSGSEAVTLGAVAGGCDYVCGYPMSPATGVLENMAAYSAEFGIIVEQVEDEVGVINMALGAWYAGARALISTSGGGFALMSEGISLAGMIESPLVLHLAQRPGPATGLPTRTEQGDLNLVLYAGHGDFPRIILAPGTLAEGFSLTRQAFDLSARFQVPVFILTDQYFVDSKYTTPVFDTDTVITEKHLVETDMEYKRFAFTDTGISPRGIPGYGTGSVCTDSDEHDESGHITEDFDMRIQMTDKRNRKMESVIKSCIPPTLTGSDSYKTLIVCWGSTYHIVNEAVSTLNDPDIAILHFAWVHPLPPGTREYLEKASTVISVENNVTGQFAQLVKSETGYDIRQRILKYNGLPFSVEEVKTRLEETMNTGANDE